MLIITRRVGESFTVDGPAEVRILDSRGLQVRIGVQADKSVKILRTELIRAAPGPSPPKLPAG